MSNRNVIVGAVIVFLLVVVGATLLQYTKPKVSTPIEETIIESTTETVATSTTSVIGTSVQGRTISATTFGTGDTDIFFIGGMHGGYEWNSILLAQEMSSYLHENPTLIPENITVHIIPNLNPDGLFIATGLEGTFAATDIPNRDIHTAGIGRFNANNVDLNRNFDCKWAPQSTWRGAIVDAGTAAFSEPEAVALRDYVTTVSPQAVVFWHSIANTVYASECYEGILPGTLTLMNTYANAARYNTVEKFDAYPITGDAEGWLASIGIPAITVELETRDSIEWQRNLAGFTATMNLYSQ